MSLANIGRNHRRRQEWAGRAAAHRPTHRFRCRRSGNLALIPPRETEITQSFEPEAPPPGPAGPPPGLANDVWPWLALLGILALAGLLVWLFVFRGHHHRHSRKTVPQVVGMQEQVAIKELTGAGYSVKSIHEPLRRPRGVVGSEAANGSVVVIHVSNGKPLPSSVTTTERTTTTTRTTTAAAPTSAVPDVTGQTAAAGAGQVEAAGFVAETDPVQAGGAAGSVVQESPPGGAQAKAGETVTLGIAVGSSRPTVQIPNVTGQAAAAARAALLQAKLTVRTTYAQGKTGVVLSQAPTGSAPAWTQVTISVGR
jgi:serine/threonine-protein kinase